MSRKISEELYRSLILDHNRSPHHFGVIADFTQSQKGVNASCGDKLEMYAKIDNGVLQDVGFVGEGCAIFKASCSMLTDQVIGKPLGEVKEILANYLDMVLKKEDLDSQKTPSIGKLSSFSNVKNYPGRVKCALLGARTLQAIVEDPESVSGDAASKTSVTSTEDL